MLLVLARPAMASGERLILAEDGRSVYSIQLPAAAPVELRLAAADLRQFFTRVTGAVLPVEDREQPAGPAIFLGSSPAARRARLPVPPSSLGEEGYLVMSRGIHLLIAGRTPAGTAHGVYAFLEQVLQCRCFTSKAFRVPSIPRLETGPLHLTGKPAFSFRTIHYRETRDPLFARWHGLHHRADGELPGWGLWVHTFRTLVPAEEYFAIHPDYFAENNGRRVPDTQLCLSNPAVLELVTGRLRELMAQRPDCRYWSVSQNDTFGYCTCLRCRETDRREGGPSGSLLAFVNRVAAGFPDKIISTLAYQYSRRPPRHVKPARNVNIMLCSIECNRSRPLDRDAGSRDFVRDVEGWRKITRNILMWDYVINFSHLLAPFPNLGVLQPNLRFFQRQQIPAIFEQGNGGPGGEMCQLRAYLLAKLLWNPGADVASLTADFLEGYYGPAAPFIQEYLVLQQAELARSGLPLTIYEPPSTYAGGYLRPELLARYERLFDQAGARVAGDPELVRRIREARLPVMYARLEITRHLGAGPDGLFLVENPCRFTIRSGLPELLERFTDWAVHAGIPLLHETSLPPAEYRNAYQSSIHDGFRCHAARGRPVRLQFPFNPKYPGGGPQALTDGVRGHDEWHSRWQGFEENDLVAAVDLGQPAPLRRMAVSCLQDSRSWIFFPVSVTFEYSEDGETFLTADTVFGDDARPAVRVERREFAVPAAVTARYIRVTARNRGRCPDWHLGAGGKAWLFADEIIVE